MEFYENEFQVPVFHPTWEEFQDFANYLNQIQNKVTKGICKIIPPYEWKKLLFYKNNWLEDFEIPNPVKQYISGRKGIYQITLVETPKIKASKFKKIAEKETIPHSSKYDDYNDIERIFWKNIRFNPPIYGADMEGSLFKTFKKKIPWDLNELNSILNILNVELPGITTPYLYFGMWKAMFAWHVEDMNLFSINYLHYGEPKSWYCIAPEYGHKLENLAQNYFPDLYKSCPEFLRHKTTMISPFILLQHNIPFSKCTQKEGEFIVTFPYAYHCGFNHGFNCAESVNFALDSWIDYGKKANNCKCVNDTVFIYMDIFCERYKLWKNGELDLTQEPKQRFVPINQQKTNLIQNFNLLQQQLEKKKEETLFEEKLEKNSYSFNYIAKDINKHLFKKKLQNFNKEVKENEYYEENENNRENIYIENYEIDENYKDDDGDYEEEKNYKKKKKIIMKEEDDSDEYSPKKKKKINHKKLQENEIKILENQFYKSGSKLPNKNIRERLMKKLKMSPSGVYNWFKRKEKDFKKNENQNVESEDSFDQKI